jgi:beta-glucanase (GH16 family)
VANVEAETGQRQGAATAVHDTQASGGTAVRFGTPDSVGAGCGGQAPAKTGGGAWQCDWSDEFNGTTLDRTKWEAVDPDVPNDQGYGGLGSACFVDDDKHILVGGGNLTLRVTYEPVAVRCNNDGYEPRNFIGAQVWTHKKKAWTFGRFEMRAKFPKGKGFAPAFWMMAEENRYNDAHAEIDILEALTFEGSRAYATIWPDWTGDVQGNQCNIIPNYYDDFHLYTMEWGRGSFRISYDNKVCFETTSWTPPAPRVFPQPLDQPEFIILSHMTRGFATSAENDPDSTTIWPGDFVVDYVRVWK